VKQFTKRHGKTIKGVSLQARMKLGSYPWPGNVRQLRNVVESMVVVDCDETLDLDDLPLELEPDVPPVETPPRPDSVIATLVGKPLEEIEKLFIAETLKLTGGNREQAAALLGIGERTLYRKIKEFELP
jgi:two-component system response regulator HydG